MARIQARRLPVPAPPVRARHETIYTYDGDGNLLTERRVVGTLDVGSGDDVVTTYEYYDGSGDEPAGALKKITDALNVVTHYFYNALGLVTSVVYAEGTAVEGTVAYDYDADENLISTIDELGRETTYDYDLLGRMLRRCWGVAILRIPRISCECTLAH